MLAVWRVNVRGARLEASRSIRRPLQSSRWAVRITWTSKVACKWESGWSQEKLWRWSSPRVTDSSVFPTLTHFFALKVSHPGKFLSPKKTGAVGVLVHPGCCNKIPQPGCLIDKRNLFLTVLDTGSPRSECQHDWVRALFQIANFLLFFPQAPLPNILPLQIRILTSEYWGNASIQTIAVGLNSADLIEWWQGAQEGGGVENEWPISDAGNCGSCDPLRKRSKRSQVCR